MKNISDLDLVENSENRSKIMRAVRRRDTTPEMAVRRFLHSRGFRFRVHNDKLSGSPDIVLKKYRTAIFVHGCFWHRHLGCKKASTPKTRAEFWRAKFERNIARDAACEHQLRNDGWDVIVVWECETKTEDGIAGVLRELLKEKEARIEGTTQ